VMFEFRGPSGPLLYFLHPDFALPRFCRDWIGQEIMQMLPQVTQTDDRVALIS